MKFRLVTRLLLVFFRELNDFDRPWHLACAQNIHDTIVLEANTKVELLEDACVTTSCNSCLKDRKLVKN